MYGVQVYMDYGESDRERQMSSLCCDPGCSGMSVFT